MNLYLFKLIVFMTGVGLSLTSYAQTCSGSLGDPVINQNFGSGPNPGLALPAAATNLTYTSNNCPDDGYYTISNSLTSPGNCHPTTWQNLTADHTGDPNGYMMIINASVTPNIFYTQAANGLCPNTTYEFSSFILNLLTYATYLQGGYSEPDIIFSIETTSGVVLASDSTGTIPSTTDPTWVKYGTYFTTPANVTSVVLKMTNKAPGGEGNDLVLDDIAFRPCGPVIVSGFSTATGSLSENLCQGSNAVYNLTAITPRSQPLYQWQQNRNNQGWVDIAGETTGNLKINFVNAVTGVYEYRIGVGFGSNVNSSDCRTYGNPLTVNVNPLPVVAPIPAQTFCEGYPLTLTASGGSSYIWTGPGLAATSANPLIINNVTTANAGIYTLQAFSDKGCMAAPVNISVNIVPKVIAGIIKDTAICAGEKIQLTATGGLFYKWAPLAGLDHDDVANPVASPLVTTTYNVNVSNNGCNDDSKSVIITVNQPPAANAGSSKVIFEGQSIKLDGSVTGDNITGITWSPSISLSDPSILMPVASPVNNTTYTLTATSLSCGVSTSTVYVRVYKKITVPNTFTPNNDGINDLWNIDALITYPQSLITVYTRYGQQVYKSIGYTKPWDGKLSGSPLPAGTYYYIIDLKNNTSPIAGWVLIVK